MSAATIGRKIGKGFLWFLALLLVLFVVYKILSSITRYETDKTVEVAPPSSAKSNPERYAFGYQPELTYTEERENCAEQFATKKAMFGDLHIHTAVSADAFPDGTRTFPDDVYRFAKGERIALPTLEGQSQITSQLVRPLHFAAVTDHSETFGEGYICRTEGAFPGYDSGICQTFRAGGEEGVRALMGENGVPRPERQPEVCGDDGSDCIAADKIIWQDMIRSAQDAYDTSPACKFTSFVGYEYTRAPNAQHMHRNTIFRNAEVPELPASFFTHPSNHALLRAFEDECRLGIPGCDVLSIPHNSNISGGNTFSTRYMDGFSDASQEAYWKLRKSYDRLMEITQHKGTSECINGATDILGDVDELCDVEAMRQFGKVEKAVDLTTWLPSLFNSESPECSDEHLDGMDNLYKGFCLSSRDYARGALLYGMEHQQNTGINPFEFGFIGSTDTHVSGAGMVNEETWPGHIAYEVPLEGRLSDEIGLGRFNRVVSNPGGLAGVYAVENSRDAIFQSMKRREAFATSGTRIEPRFFAGQYSADMCGSNDWLAQAYRTGTPMGSQLAPQSEAFQLLVQAQRDPLSNPLERLQLIKGWIDAEGQKHSKVIDLATSDGADNLCAVYTDADYNPSQPTYYYMRAVETTSERWSQRQCQALPANKRPAECSNEMPAAIHEMAWASPIWFTPNSGPNAGMPITAQSAPQATGGGHGHAH